MNSEAVERIGSLVGIVYADGNAFRECFSSVADKPRGIFIVLVFLELLYTDSTLGGGSN